MSGKPLSDRIIESAFELKRIHAAHPLAVSLLLNGTTDGRDEKQVMSRILIYYLAMEKQVLNLYNNTANRAQTEEEKQFFAKLMQSLKVFFEKYETSFEQLFGAMDKSLMCEPLPQNIWSYMQHLAAETANGSYVVLLTLMLSTFEVIHGLSVRVRDNPGFKPNHYYEWWTNDKENMVHFINAMKALIDSKESQVSADEESYLKELYKRIAIYEIMYLDVCWDKEKYIQFL